MDLFSKACDDFGLTISTKKTEVLFQQAPATPYTEPTIIVNGEKLKVAEKYLLMIIHISYPGQALLSVGFMTKYGKEEVSSWRPSSKYIAQSSCPPYSTPVKPGQCTVPKQLKYFHMCCLRNIKHIKWQDTIPDTEVLQRAEMESVFVMLKCSQLRWAGHVCHMSDERLPKRLFYGELHSQGGQRKCYKDCLKASLKCCNISLDSWEDLAQENSAWRTLLRSGCRGTRQVAYQNSSRSASIARADSAPHLWQTRLQHSPVHSATKLSERGLDSSAIFAPTASSDLKESWSSSPMKDGEQHMGVSTLSWNIYSGSELFL